MKNFTVTYLDTVIAGLDRLLCTSVLSDYDIGMFRTEFNSFYGDMMRNDSVPFFAKSRLKHLEQFELRELSKELSREHKDNYLFFSLNSPSKKRRVIKEKLLHLKDELIDVRIMILSSIKTTEREAQNSDFKITSS